MGRKLMGEHVVEASQSFESQEELWCVVLRSLARFLSFFLLGLWICFFTLDEWMDGWLMCLYVP
jgi:hypothetical protein